MKRISRAAVLVGASSTLCAAASLAIAAAAHAAPSVAYTLRGKKGSEIHLVNPTGSGDLLLYSTSSGIPFIDMNPVANQLAFVDTTGATGFKLINYSSTGVRQSVVPVNDGCAVSGIDFHPTDGSLLVGEYCPNEDMIQISTLDACRL